MSANDDTVDWWRLVAYFEGTCSASDRAALDQWIAANPERQTMVAKMRVLWESRQQTHAHQTRTHRRSIGVDESAIIDRVMAAVRSSNNTLPFPARDISDISGSRGRSQHVRVRFAGKPVQGRAHATITAIAVAVCAIVAMVLINPVRHSSDKLQRTYATGRAQQKTVRLDDSTVVRLGPATTLRVFYTSNHRGHMTTVQVDGNAWFTVAPRNNAAFVVRAGSATTQVLGTTFGVRHYATDRNTRVVVANGRVAVRGTRQDGNRMMGHEGAVLSAKMLGIINDSGLVRVVPEVVLDDYTAWMSGRLVFRNTSIAEIVETLGRTYAADIRVPDSTLRYRTATLTIPAETRSLGNVLELLAVTLDARITYKDSVITIMPRPAGSQKHRPHFAPSRNPIPSHPSEIQYDK